MVVRQLTYSALRHANRSTLRNSFITAQQARLVAGSSSFGCNKALVGSVSRALSTAPVHYNDDDNDQKQGGILPHAYDENVVTVLTTTQDWHPNELITLAVQGASGVALPWEKMHTCDPPSLYKGILEADVPPTFQYWLPHHAVHDMDEFSHHDKKNIQSNVIYQVEYHPTTEESAQAALSLLKGKSLLSAIVCHGRKEDGALDDTQQLAQCIRSMMTQDATRPGFDFVYIVGQGEKDDSISQVAQELLNSDSNLHEDEDNSLKARVVIDLTQFPNDAVAEQNLVACFKLGITQVVVSPHRMKWLSTLVQKYDKRCNVQLVVGH